MKINKLFFGTIIVGTAIGLTSCEDLMNQFGMTINSDVYEIERTIEPQPAGTYEYIESAIASEIEKVLDENGRTLEELESVDVSMVTLEILDEGLTFEAFKSFEFVLSTSQVAEKVVAYIDNIPDTAKFLTLNIDPINVMDYITADEFNIKLIAVQDKDLTDTLNILGKVKFGLNFGFGEQQSSLDL